MYRYFYGINDFPFGACPDPRFLYKMPHVQEALACLQYGIASRKGFVVMTGEVGTGKTTLLKTVLSSFTERRISTAFVFNPRLETLDFLEFVLEDFGIPTNPRNKPDLPVTKSGMLMQLNRWLIDRFRNGELCAIVVDEAQNLSWDLLEEIRLLTNLETSSEKLVQIILSGQPELEEKLRDPSVRQLRQRISLWCRTRPLTGEETKAYVARRLRIAGATQGDVFTGSGRTRPSLFEGYTPAHKSHLRACNDQRVRRTDQTNPAAHCRVGLHRTGSGTAAVRSFADGSVRFQRG